MWFERNPEKDHGNITQNPAGVKLNYAIEFVNKIVIIETPCSREEPERINEVMKPNYVYSVQDQDTLIEQSRP